MLHTLTVFAKLSVAGRNPFPTTNFNAPACDLKTFSPFPPEGCGLKRLCHKHLGRGPSFSLLLAVVQFHLIRSPANYSIGLPNEPHAVWSPKQNFIGFVTRPVRLTGKVTTKRENEQEILTGITDDQTLNQGTALRCSPPLRNAPLPRPFRRVAV